MRSTLILSRQTGAIVRASGLDSKDSDDTEDDGAASIKPEIPEQSKNGDDYHNDRRDDGVAAAKSAVEVAKMVWSFVCAAEDLVGGLSGEEKDGVKLLRLRTKRYELVIVPGKSLFA